MKPEPRPPDLHRIPDATLQRYRTHRPADLIRWHQAAGATEPPRAGSSACATRSGRYRTPAVRNRRSACSRRPRLLGGRSPSVTAVAGFTADAGRVPPAARQAGPSDATPAVGVTSPQRHARSPGSAGPAPAAENVSAASEAADPGRQHLKLIWSADAVANAERTWPRHNSTSAATHGTAIPRRADHLPGASPATRLAGRTSQVR
jgi:hypothetical protein